MAPSQACCRSPRCARRCSARRWSPQGSASTAASSAMPSSRWRRVPGRSPSGSAAPASSCAAVLRRTAGRPTIPLTWASPAISLPTTRPNCSRSRASSAPRCGVRSASISTSSTGTTPGPARRALPRLRRIGPQSRHTGVPRALFRAVADTMDADVLTVRHQGAAVASVLSLYHAGAVYPYWGGGTAAARSLRANDRMYFALMSHARRRGCTRFDFGRSKAGTGAAAFKKNWGFDPVPRSLCQAKRRPCARDQSAQPEIRADGTDVAAPAVAGRQRDRTVAVARARLMDILFPGAPRAVPARSRRQDQELQRPALSRRPARACIWSRLPRMPPTSIRRPRSRTELASCTVLPRDQVARTCCHAEALATGRPVSLTAFADPAMRRAVAATMASHPIDAVYCLLGPDGAIPAAGRPRRHGFRRCRFGEVHRLRGHWLATAAPLDAARGPPARRL